MKMTKEEAKAMIRQSKDETYYFDGVIAAEDMNNFFLDLRFGEAEANVILAALVLAGAKFT